jgi:hypothetical protein
MKTITRWDPDRLRLYAELDEFQHRLRLRDNLHRAYELEREIEFTSDRDLRALVSWYVKFCDRGYCRAAGLESHE